MQFLDAEKEIEQALTLLESRLLPKQSACIRHVVYANLRRGRLDFCIHRDPANTPAKYVERVAENYLRLGDYLHQVQVEKSAQVWQPLYERLKKWCLNFLIKKGFAYGQETLDLALECASDASAALTNASFPYDTEFDPWAVTLTYNICRKLLRDRSRHSPNSASLVALEDETALKSELKLHTDLLERAEMRHDLKEVLAQLKEAHRQVITLFYFEGLAPAEIAARLGEPQHVVYRLKFEALKELRNKLVQSGY